MAQPPSASRAARAEIAKPAAGRRRKPEVPPTRPSRSLDVFDNPQPERDYAIQFQVPEFTCTCPLTGQPDFAHFTIDMVCDRLCIELKSLKLYFWSYRDQGSFHEKVTNQVLDDIVAASQPRFARVSARWYVRGGIYTTIVAEHRRPDWTPQPRVELPDHPRETGLPG